MLRPIKYLVITLAAMATIASLSVVQAKLQANPKIKANLVADTTQIQQSPQDQSTGQPDHSQPEQQASAQDQPAAPAPKTTPVASPPAPVQAAKPAATNTGTNAQTGAQKATQQNTVRSQSGQTINMSNATNFNTSSMAAVNAAAQSDTSCVSGGFQTQFLCLINNYRASLGLHTLVLDSKLDEVGQTYASYMDATGRFSHTDANGATFLDRCKAAGTTCWAENLAFSFTSPQTLFQMWKASPGHNANMVNPGYRSMGLGVSGSYAALYLR